MSARSRGGARRLALLVTALAIGLFVIVRDTRRDAHESSGGGGHRSEAAPGAEGDRTLATAFDERRSNVEVEGRGVVSRLLADDVAGNRHQRFVLRLASGQTVLVAHNIDLAARVEELREGDTLAFRGEYEWNAQGGVVHWTHHDPAGRRAGGWLRHRGRSYE